MLKENEEIVVNIGDWINKAKIDSETYLERQATEIFLTALGEQPWSGSFFLKGGLLMGIVYDSPRQTADIDLTTILDPDKDIVEEFKAGLNTTFPQVSTRLGYLDIICKVQSIHFLPHKNKFTDAEAPAIKVKIGYAQRNTPQEERLNRGLASRTLSVDISYREPVGGIQIVRLREDGSSINAYSLHAVLAEKYRAFLQQEIRDRMRRQDIYDIHLLVSNFSLDDDEKNEVLTLLREKCEARGITPEQTSMRKQENIERAQSEWDTLKLELEDLPSFDECFATAKKFYEELPW